MALILCHTASITNSTQLGDPSEHGSDALPTHKSQEQVILAISNKEHVTRPSESNIQNIQNIQNLGTCQNHLQSV